MNPKKLILVAACGVCALVVFVMLQRMNQPEPVAPVQVTDTPTEVIQVVETPMSHILVVAADLPYGHKITPEDLQWQKWPDEAIGLGYIDQDTYPDALERFSEGVARRELLEGEPMTERKVVFPEEGGIMPALLAPGMRAASALISPETAVGGFINPNDRVDILITTESDNGGAQFGGQASFTTRTVLENVRVLAIDQTFGEGIDGQPYLIGSTATFELTPDDAELLVRSQASGELSLTLRSIRDADGVVSSRVKKRSTEDGQTVTIIRGGKRSQAMVGGGQ